MKAATRAPLFGRVANFPEWQDSAFKPDTTLKHGERIELGPDTTLRVIHTPGHASNHLCYLLEQEKLLFTGDHLMQGSTVVINPPDGDMQAYLQSLRLLLDEDLEWLAPGHGFLIDRPHEVVHKTIAHRLQREAKVVAAIRADRARRHRCAAAGGVRRRVAAFARRGGAFAARASVEVARRRPRQRGRRRVVVERPLARGR